MANLGSFSRLKGVFLSSINLKNYKNIISACTNTDCGNIPKDLLRILLSKGSKTKQTDIAAVKSIFADATDMLTEGINISRRAKNIQLFKGLKSSFDKDKIVSLDFLRDMDLSNALLAPASTARIKGLEETSKRLTERLSQIIPECAQVGIKPLGAGAYGHGFKLEFLDSAGEKLIHDKVLKVFYKEGESQVGLYKTVFSILTEKSKEFSLRDIVKMWNNIKNLKSEEVMTFLKPFEEQFAKQGLSITPEAVEEALTNLRTVKLKDIKPLFTMMKEIPPEVDIVGDIQGLMSKQHGVYAEANTMMFIRKRLGHSLRKTNVVAPDYYNLQKGFSIAEFSDDLLPASSSDVMFETLGLQHCDSHDANIVANRIIDLGGVQLTKPELCDKLTARYYKKIINQKNPELRRKYIEQLEKEMEHMNYLDREKIRTAIRLVA